MANETNSASGLGLGLVQDAYDRYVEFALRAQPLIRAIADKRPVKQAMPGDAVVLQRYVDLAQATTTLTETADVSNVEVADTTKVTVTLLEKGNAVVATRKLEATALADVDPALANLIAYNQADSIDAVVETTLRGGTNVVRRTSGTLRWNSGTTATITATDTLTSDMVRTAVVKLRGNNSIPRRGSLYHALVHPDVSYDLRKESGAGSWRAPHEYADPGNIYTGEIGIYEGAFFVESPRLYTANDGATSTKVYRGYVVGQQALAEAVAIEPHVVIGPVTDKLMRFRPIGWYGLLGHAIYRQESIVRLEAASAVAV